ncbi:MAG: thioredoxin family protein [Bacteroidota bacterium]
MKYFLLSIVIAIVMSACFTSQKTGKASYVIISDTETKVLKGTLSRALIENDTAFAWFKENMRYGSADAFAVEQFKQKSAAFSVLIFAGTWCHDSQNLLPKFYRLVDKSGFPETKVTLIGVDRPKTAPNDLHLKWNIVSVPTFIILKNGKEAGRVVEYGKTGNMERELAEIVAGL